MLIPENSDPVYQINVTIIRNIHNHHHHLSNNWTGANFSDWMPLMSFHQLRISRRTNLILGNFQTYLKEQLTIPGDFQYFQEL